MGISLGILFGIIAMLAWGTADFFAAKAVRKTSVFKTFFWSQITGTVLLLPIFFLFFEFPAISFSAMIIILVIAFLGVTSILAFYKGLQVGNVSIISPVAASAAVITVILSVIFLNEKLTGLQAAGIILAISGAVLTSFKFHDLIKLKLKNISSGVEYAIYAMFAWGVIFVLIAILVSELGWFMPIFLIMLVESVYLLLFSGVTKKNISFPKNVGLLVVVVGVLEIAGFLSIGIAITSEYASIVAPISAAFPAITIILARIFFKEILELNQKIGIVAVLTGLVLLSI